MGVTLAGYLSSCEKKRKGTEEESIDLEKALI